jgi:hypothetical protein
LNDTSEVLSTPIGRVSHARSFIGSQNSGIGAPPTLLTLGDSVIEEA